MSNPRVFQAHPRAGGLLGGDGLFGDPFSGFPGLGGLSTALSPILTPIGLPGPKSTKTSATVSATVTSPTISLTTPGTSASATSTSATSTSTSDTSSATSSSSATSESSLSTSDTASTTSTQQSATASATDSATAPPAASNTATGAASLPSSSSSSSAAPSGTADASNTPKSFLQNKALSVGVITAASLVGLVLIIAIATWAIRKRRNERIHQDILDFSTANLVSDAEKGAGSGGGGGAGGSIEGGSSNGHGSSSGHGVLSQPQVQPRGMYESSGYAPSQYAPAPAPSRMANAYPAQPAYNTYAFPSQEQNTTYGNWNYGYGNAAAAAPQQQQPQNQNQFDQAYGGVEDAYGGLAYDAPVMAGVGAGAQSQGPQRRPSAHRKPPPALYIAPPNPIAEAVATNAPSPISSVSLTKPPLQAAAGMGAAQPARRTSLLNSPAVENGAPRERKDTLTHVELLDPSAPKVPAASPRLPDEFGVGAPPASKDSPVEQPVRRLVVRNE